MARIVYTAPKVDPSMEAAEAREKLQDALKEITALMNLIGEVTASQLIEAPDLISVLRYCSDMKKRIVDLATMEIPF